MCFRLQISNTHNTNRTLKHSSYVTHSVFYAGDLGGVEEEEERGHKGMEYKDKEAYGGQMKPNRASLKDEDAFYLTRTSVQIALFRLPISALTRFSAPASEENNVTFTAFESAAATSAARVPISKCAPNTIDASI